MLSNVRIVLVETSHPGNIGGAARAMKNMALGDLVLVRPQRFPDPDAEARAAGASDLLTSARVVDSLDDAIGDCQLVIGTSARERRIPWPLVDPRAAAERVREAQPGRTAILFGRERTGLSNEELHRCHAHVHIPTNPDYSSLNLAAAVQVLCYELRMAALASSAADQSAQEWDVEPASSADLERMFAHLEDTLLQLNFFDPDNPRQVLTRLRRLMMRVAPDRMEVAIVRGMLTAVQARIGSQTDSAP